MGFGNERTAEKVIQDEILEYTLELIIVKVTGLIKQQS